MNEEAKHTGDTFVLDEKGQPQDITAPEKEPETPATPDGKAETPEDKPVKDKDSEEPGDPEEATDDEPEKPAEKPKESRADQRKKQIQAEIRELLEKRNKLREEEGGDKADTKPKPEEKPLKRPRLVDYDNHDEYEQALDEYEAEKEERLTEKLKSQTRQEIQHEQSQAALIRKVEKAVEKFPDFVEIAVNNAELKDALEKNPYVAAFIRDSEHFTELAYHLGTNIDEADRIAGLQPMQAAVELGKLEFRLTATSSRTTEDKEPKPKQPSEAPEPPETVTGKGERSLSDDDIPTEDWMKKRNKQIASRR